MSLQPYSEYKDSGIDWLGHVPRHWKITRLKNSISEAKNGVWGLEPDGSELDLRCVRVADFDRPRLSIHDRNATLRKIPFSEQTGRILEKGDLLLEKSGGGEKSPVGFVVLYDRDEPAVCSNFVARLVLRPGMDSQFWTYLHSMLYSRRLTQRSIKQTTGIQNLDQASYFDELVAFPTDTEQRDIAEFLDRETAEIDAFIADQERLIELLEERRAATITHAVTKGLDPDAPMRDSGIDWLGTTEIPAAWRSWKMSHLLRLQSGDSLTSQSIEESGAYPVYGGGGFRGYTATFTNDGDHALIGRQGALCGNIKRATGKFFATEHAIVVYPLQELNTVWLTAILQTMNLGQYSQSAAQPGISVEVISQKKLPVPPLAEQHDIADFLDRELSGIDTAVSDAREAIALSQERRAALISAAATGQLDVSQAQSRGSAGEVLGQGVRV